MPASARNFLIISIIPLAIPCRSFHDCIQASQTRRQRRKRYQGISNSWDGLLRTSDDDQQCAGGICVGMTNGPHQGGNASYPVGWNGTAATFVKSRMMVPSPPLQKDGITYYLWTDIFFGDAGRGRMNQFVPQLILGSVLDSSSGPPEYKPQWHYHDTWMFGAHYFFETAKNATSADSKHDEETQAHAAYGDLHPAFPGEYLYTSFELIPGKEEKYKQDSPTWVLTMGVEGDDSRVSTLIVEQPYMGMGATWDEDPTTSWLEQSYHNLCINACWEIYGAKDAAHLPQSGTHYDLKITQPAVNEVSQYPFTSWVRDEGNGNCPFCDITEHHSAMVQRVNVNIYVGQEAEVTWL